MNFELAKEKAIKYIAISKKTKYEVRVKLQKLGAQESVIEEVIEYLSNLNYLNDDEYVDAYIRQCMRLLNYSIYEIKNKLLQKGIDKYIIEEKLYKLEDTNYEKKLVEKLLNGKLKSQDELKKRQYLYRRGLKYNNFEEI